MSRVYFEIRVSAEDAAILEPYKEQLVKIVEENTTPSFTGTDGKIAVDIVVVSRGGLEGDYRVMMIGIVEKTRVIDSVIMGWKHRLAPVMFECIRAKISPEVEKIFAENQIGVIIQIAEFTRF